MTERIQETTKTEKGPEYEDMRRLGLISTSGGIQIDINTVPKRLGNTVVDGHKCDHNCLRKHGAGYDCPAASMVNIGLKSDFPDVGSITSAIVSASAGVRIGNEILINEGHFEDYCHKFSIPPAQERQMREVMQNGSISVNLFGGNPEMHPGLFGLADTLSKLDPKISLNLTTTGRRSITHHGWIEGLVDSPILSVALSCDDIDVELLEKTSQMSLDDTANRWEVQRRTAPLSGTKQKALEAIYTAKALHESSIPVTFNLVVHSGNIRDIEEITGQLANQFPNARVNPFPAQSSMDNTAPTFDKSDLHLLEQIVDWTIDVHTGNTAPYPLTPRLHYWIMLKASFETYKNDADRLQHAVSGYGLWNCYDYPGAARYLQIGASLRRWSTSKQVPGLHLGCYWNQTVTNHSTQVFNMNANQIGNYMSGGISEISKHASTPCAGCIMPRLTFDMYSQEVGMNPQIIPSYLELRQEHLGF
ncbi:hypothetical protein C4564_03445 [Candidatus Microgenomates bacterium]|nr:MAG: hypothetical protein C4564_03445 [Candidatus Microgenomates bacterium]